MPRPGSLGQKRIEKGVGVVCVRVGGGGGVPRSFASVERGQRIMRWVGGGRSRRLYLRSLRSTAANRLPFPLSFLLLSISRNQDYLLFVSPFAASSTSFVESLDCSWPNFARFICGLLSLDYIFLSPFLDRGTDSSLDIDVFETSRCILSFSWSEERWKWMDNKRNRSVTVVFRSRGGE